MDAQDIKEVIVKELPTLLKEDPETAACVRSLTKDRFESLLDEIRREREAEAEKWNRLAEERAEERRKDTEKWNKLAEERRRDADRWDRLAEERAREQEDTESKMGGESGSASGNDAGEQKAGQEDRQQHRSIGARWGLHSEQSFRNALKAILEEHFGVRVLNVLDFDAEGEVFSRPDQIELDIIITNGILIICEIKSSISRSEMHAFYRKAQYFEKRHQTKATRRTVPKAAHITPKRREAPALNFLSHPVSKGITASRDRDNRPELPQSGCRRKRSARRILDWRLWQAASLNGMRRDEMQFGVPIVPVIS
jgi:hypothetical protein